jgi:methyl-accepting chemotaxis protein
LALNAAIRGRLRGSVADVEEVSVGVVAAAQQNAAAVQEVGSSVQEAAAAGRLMAGSAEELVGDAEELRALVGRRQV